MKCSLNCVLCTTLIELIIQVYVILDGRQLVLRYRSRLGALVIWIRVQAARASSGHGNSIASTQLIYGVGPSAPHTRDNSALRRKSPKILDLHEKVYSVLVLCVFRQCKFCNDNFHLSFVNY